MERLVGAESAVTLDREESDFGRAERAGRVGRVLVWAGVTSFETLWRKAGRVAAKGFEVGVTYVAGANVSGFSSGLHGSENPGNNGALDAPGAV